MILTGNPENPEKSREYIISNKNGKRKQQRRNTIATRILQKGNTEDVTNRGINSCGKTPIFCKISNEPLYWMLLWMYKFLLFLYRYLFRHLYILYRRMLFMYRHMCGYLHGYLHGLVYGVGLLLLISITANSTCSKFLGTD